MYLTYIYNISNITIVRELTIILLQNPFVPRAQTIFVLWIGDT